MESNMAKGLYPNETEGVISNPSQNSNKGPKSKKSNINKNRGCQ